MYVKSKKKPKNPKFTETKNRMIIARGRKWVKWVRIVTRYKPVVINTS